MREKVVVKSSGGIGLCGALAIVFIILKLVGVINWSWLWVLCPLWIGFALFGTIGIIIIVVAIIAAMLGKN